MHFPQLRTVFASALRLLIASLLLTTGLRAQNSADGRSSSAESSPPPTAESDYLLRQGDVLQVKVFQHEDLTREVSVSREFAISLPLINSVDLRNKTVRQAEELIRAAYDRDYIVNPQVTVLLVKYAERSVNVLGMVNQPQAVPFPPEKGLTLMQAISRAGGFNRLADRKRITITRTDKEGQTQTFTVNADRLLNSSSDNSWPLQVDDVIYVPEGIL